MSSITKVNRYNAEKYFVTVCRKAVLIANKSINRRGIVTTVGASFEKNLYYDTVCHLYRLARK